MIADESLFEADAPTSLHRLNPRLLLTVVVRSEARTFQKQSRLTVQEMLLVWGKSQV
jgi:hypothetical protein